jgi:flagellar biosynthesis/type III secretory pathway protein FliH
LSEAFIWPELRARPANVEQGLAALREQALAEGRSAGLEQGRAEGRRLVEAELPALRQQLQNAIAQLEESVESFRDRQSATLTAAVQAVCCRLLGVELRSNPQAVEHVLEECLARLDSQGGAAEVHLHPDDHAAIQSAYEGTLTLIADPEIPACGMSVRLPTQAADFDPVALIEELFEDARDEFRS